MARSQSARSRKSKPSQAPRHTTACCKNSRGSHAPAGAQSLHSMTMHHIVTIPGPPVAQKPRRLASDRLAAAKKQFGEMLRLGLARHGEGPWASPLHMVPKKGEEWRPCGEYRALNARTCPDQYPVPHIQEFAQALHGATVFSTVDLVCAFNQIPVAKEDIPKTAITAPFGLFEFPFMTFGLRNTAQTFQRFIDNVLRGLDFCYAYIDDILISSSLQEEHLNHLRTLFQRLENYGVVINPGMCIRPARSEICRLPGVWRGYLPATREGRSNSGF